jgi:hypothetical protein
MVSGIVGAIGRWPATILFSLQACVNALGDALLGAPRETALPWAYPALVLAAVAVASLAVLRSRVRAVEIVR